jgi:hypothetical protein
MYHSRTSRLATLLITSIGVASSLDAQAPDFAGRWTVRPDSARPGQGAPVVGNPGSGWGASMAITQDTVRLVVESAYFSRYDMQPPLRYVYALNGAETTNTVMIGQGMQAQRSRAAWSGPTLIITTAHVVANPAGTGDSLRVEVTRRLSLESPMLLVVETTRAGVLGGSPSTTRTVYTKQQ